MNLILILITLMLFYLFLLYLIDGIPQIQIFYKYTQQDQQNIHFNKFPKYTRPCYSILDMVPPPDPHQEYRCNNFSKKPTGYTDFQRWKNEWSSDSVFI